MGKVATKTHSTAQRLNMWCAGRLSPETQHHHLALERERLRQDQKYNQLLAKQKADKAAQEDAEERASAERALGLNFLQEQCNDGKLTKEQFRETLDQQIAQRRARNEQQSRREQ